MISDVPTDLVRVLGGAWLHAQHFRIRDRLRRRTAQILRERDQQELVELSPNIAPAIVSGAQEESQEELMELWVRLLASAMNPTTKINVRYSFIAAVKQMDLLMHELVLHIQREGGSHPARRRWHYKNGYQCAFDFERTKGLSSG